MLPKSIILILILSCAHSAKILGIFPMCSISHYILYSKLMKGLIHAGNDVTMVSPYSMDILPGKGNYTEITLDEFARHFDENLKNFNLFENEDRTKGIVNDIIQTDFFLPGINATLHHPKMKKLVDSKPQFDVLILEQFNNEALRVYSHIFNIPMILLSTMGHCPWVNPIVGNPVAVSYIPHLYMVDSDGQFNFFKRAKNLLAFIADFFIRNYYVFPKHNQIKNALYPNTPSVQELAKNVSIVFVNSHTSFLDPFPLVPNVIEVGGYFIDPPQKLPEELQKFMDDAPHGVVYFSMGSNLKSRDIAPSKKQMILNVLGKLKQKVIWKFEEELPGKPDNVLIMKWCPQKDILAHPNIRLFITHAGILGNSEAIYHGIPILAIPVFMDQPANAAKAVAAGYALSIHYDDPRFNEETISYLINELLNNPSYSENAKYRAKLFHDRPMKPMETISYWVEYVARYKGAPHMRVKGADMPWYQYFMVDVIAVFLVLIYMVILLVRIFAKLFYAAFAKLFCCNGKFGYKDSKKKE